MKLGGSLGRGALLATSAFCVFGATSTLQAAPAVKVQVIQKFTAGSPKAYAPTGELSFGKDGALYGVTRRGGKTCPTGDGALGCGVIYRLTPPPKKTGGDWTYQVIYSFKGGADGDRPIGKMAFDDDGNLYGVTTYGGKCAYVPNGGCGTVWRLKPGKKPGDAWKHEVLHTFDAAKDGKWPANGLVRNGEAFFGATDGVVYQVKP